MKTKLLLIVFVGLLYLYFSFPLQAIQNDSLLVDSTTLQEEQHQPFFNNFIISLGIGKPFSDFNFTNHSYYSPVANISSEHFLSLDKSWSFEIGFFGFYSEFSFLGALSAVIRYNFKFFSDTFYPSLHFGGLPFPIPLLSMDTGLDFNYNFYKDYFLRCGIRLMTQSSFESGQGFIIINLNLRYQINY